MTKAESGRLGGLARKRNMTPRQRSEAARRAALAVNTKLTAEQRRLRSLKAWQTKRRRQQEER